MWTLPSNEHGLLRWGFSMIEFADKSLQMRKPISFQIRRLGGSSNSWNPPGDF